MRTHRWKPCSVAAALWILGLCAVVLLSSCAGTAEAADSVSPDPDSPVGDVSGDSPSEPVSKPTKEEAAGATDDTSSASETARDEAPGGKSAARASSAVAEKESTGWMGDSSDSGSSGTPSPSPSPSVSESRARPSASGLRAGFADDNRQFNYFVDFLDTYADMVEHHEIPIGERITNREREKN